ncbi:hypothetical protein Dsin_002021 [Dipteronia sinensis]|uniref:Protein kinase domain-containing protein n=1 Tax=Dipteronia sinensis TaxID=43782 RepID=A0AAE0EKV0_9ROSI|nr:hypothetical protein Dsin_002021 [Dipteronia sinensis]
MVLCMRAMMHLLVHHHILWLTQAGGGTINTQYKTSIQYYLISQIQYTQLFETARISASSLRCYGLGLENGNYNVTLSKVHMDLLFLPSVLDQGKLGDGRIIAVKQLSVASRQGKSQVVAEIVAISAVQHRQRSLNLNWTTRYDICLGVARGLAYLHEESRLRIIHRDVKASNILLDSDLFPKISDFGLAKLYDDKKTHISTRVSETIRYLAPEYAMRGHLTEKTDVFAFGVMTLEIISGRPHSDSSFDEERIYLLEWAWQLLENNHEVELVDSRLSEFNGEEVKRMIGVALLCTQTLPSLRPPMPRAVSMLCGDVEVNKVTTKPAYLTDWKFDDITSFTTSDKTTNGTDTSYYTSSSTSTSMVAEPRHAEESGSKPIQHDIM